MRFVDSSSLAHKTGIAQKVNLIVETIPFVKKKDGRQSCKSVPIILEKLIISIINPIIMSNIAKAGFP